MPSYYNPYNFYPASYQNPIGYSGISQPAGQQSFASMPKVMEWVEGEVGAKAYQMPPGWPPNQLIPLWDSTDTNIFLKSWSPMGFPNPLQKIHYEMPQQQSQTMLPTASGDSAPDMSQYVTKDDLNQIRQEIRNMMSHQNAGNNQNGSRGGNK